MESPIGGLIVDAETRSKKKASRNHKSTADCECSVEVSWFSEDSRTVAIRRCPDHEYTHKSKAPVAQLA